MSLIVNDIKLTFAQVAAIHEKMYHLQVKSVKLEQTNDKYTHLYTYIAKEQFHLSKAGKWKKLDI